MLAYNAFKSCSCPGRMGRMPAKARPVVQVRVFGGVDPNDPRLQEAMQRAMQDPKVMEQVKAMASNPEVIKQLQEMQAFMANQQLQERLKQLKDDPELADMFEDIKKNGPAALNKYWNDPKVLAKLSDKVSDVAPSATAPPASAMTPEINNLIDAARYGDIEAVEDFIAIGKDVNMQDSENRTPLHFAAGTGQDEIVKILIENGANLENTDSLGNTPLHYAAGYGRPRVVEVLLMAGANKEAKNNNGKTPADLVKQAPANPVNQEAGLLSKLGA